VPPQVIGPAPEVAQEYMKALSVAFFQMYIADQSDYQVYLSASYAQYISQSIIPLSLIQTLTPIQLTGVTAAEASQQPSSLQP
jgi:predicted dienelactone hydrolase